MDLQTVIVLASVCPLLVVIAVKFRSYVRRPQVPEAGLEGDASSLATFPGKPLWNRR